MTSSLDHYARNVAPVPDTPDSRLAEVLVGEKDGKVTKVLLPSSVQADDAALLRGASLDPNAWVITPGSRRHKRWQRYDGEWLNWWSFDFQERTVETDAERTADIAELKALFKKAKPKPREAVSGDDAFVFVVADLQTGKSSEYTINKFRQAVSDAKARIKHLRRAGHSMPTLAIVGLGDLIEGCDGHYAMQTFGVDLDRRGQVKVVRRLLRELIEELAPLFSEVVVVCVGGNHGENRKDGKAYTSFADNDDVAVFEVLQEILDGRPGYEHVRFHVPDDQLSVCLQIAGVNVGLTHGHLMSRGGKLAANKAFEWWSGQIMGLQPVANAQILLTGHYHHLSIVGTGPRWHLQAPALDNGSKWWTDVSGQQSAEGVLTFRLDSKHPFFWDDLKVL